MPKTREPFDPKSTKYPYPEKTDEHYLVIKKDNGHYVDKDYPFVDNSPSIRRKRFWVRLLLRLIVFPFSRIYIGLKIKGRKIIKKHKELLKHGALMCSNHVHLWDYIAIMKAVRPHKPAVVVWEPNIRGENGTLIRLVGGIPIPEKHLSALKPFRESLKKELDNGRLIQVYAEGSMWEYYAPIRPLKNGIAHMAREFDKPIIPMAFSYRKSSWLRRFISHQPACFTLNIGEPLFVDKTLPEEEREKELTVRLHQTICKLAGIDPASNPYHPRFNHSHRIDDYAPLKGKEDDE